MKNKVLRLAIVAVLVVAMVLSMAACTPTKVDPSPTPAGPSPSAPVAPSPSVTPPVSPVGPSDDDAVLAKATYGIELVGTNFTYGKVLEDPTKEFDKDTNKSISTLEVKVTGTLLNNFKELEIKWSVDYEGEGKPVAGDGDGKVEAGESYEIIKTDKGTATKLEFSAEAPAGIYTVTATVKTEDNGFDFGRFGSMKDEKAEFELITIVNVAKADLEIAADSYVAPVKVDDKYVPAASGFKKVEAGSGVEKALYAAYGTGKYDFYFSTASFIDVTKAGSYELVLSAHKTGADATEANIIPFDELTAINHNVTIKTGKQYFIDAYDWNVVRDTATSILELKDQANTANGVKLARARYDALTAEQKVFFATGAVVVNSEVKGTPATKYNTLPIVVGQFGATGSTTENVELATAATTGKDILKVLTDAEKAAKNAAIVAAFDKVVTDAKFDKFMGDFNIENATHVASYNAVNTYFEALSKADQKVIETANGANYQGYIAVKAKFASKEYANVQTLIAASIAAYNRAVLNAGTKGIYVDKLTSDDNVYGGVVYYVINAEVKAVTNQAKAAYDKLSKEDQKTLDTTALTNDDAYDATANFDKDALFYGKALKALDTMNSVVGYMDQVISHTKIEDLAHTEAASPAYASLKSVVFGTTNNYLTTTGRTTYNAVSDIIRAYALDNAHLGAVVDEYKAMVDYVLAGEKYKAEQIAVLKAGIAAEFVADNYTETQIARATASSNVIYGLITKAINAELGATTAIKDADVATKTATLDTTKIIKAGVNVQTNLSKNVETYAEAIEEFEGLFNVDTALSDFVKYFNYILNDKV